MEEGELIIYQSPEGNTKVEVLLHEESVWLTQKQIADLFQTTPQNITLHLKNEVWRRPEYDEFPLMPWIDHQTRKRHR